VESASASSVELLLQQLHSMEQKKVLPFGPTLHYAGCGCPSNRQQGSRVVDQVDALVLTHINCSNAS